MAIQSLLEFFAVLFGTYDGSKSFRQIEVLPMDRYCLNIRRDVLQQVTHKSDAINPNPSP